MSGSETSPPAAATTPGSEKTETPPPAGTATEQVSASGTSSEWTEQWIDVKCAFCKEELKDNSEPKLLQCLHSACKSCLTSESVPSPASTSSGVVQAVKPLHCPGCTQEINPNDTIDHLFLLEHLSQSAEGQVPEESKVYTCTNCEESATASGFCQDCQEWLCETCIHAHQRVRVTKDHTIRPKDEMEGEKTTGLSQKYLFCPVHRQEQLKLYCESCDKLTCRDCQLSEHKDHKYQFLSKACEDEKLYLNTLLAKIKEKQLHIENACNLVNKRHVEITQREQVVTQEIKTFAVKFITEINKRGKLLLQELNDVCTQKKSQLAFKNQELVNMGQRLQHCLKFAEAAISHGSDVALVYSKKIITSQLRRILRHRCEVPNPQHMVDIQFSYESSFLTQYISQLGCLLVDQHPVGGVPPNQVQNRNIPVAQAVAHQNQNNQQPVSSNAVRAQNVQGSHHQQSGAVNQRSMPLSVQQLNHQQQHQQQHGSLYGQPQVTSSTHPSQNATNPVQLRHLLNTNSQIHNTYSRNQVQNNIPSTVAQTQGSNFSVPVSVTFGQRPVAQPVRQQAPQPTLYQPVSLPAPLSRNTSITISAIPGPTAPKQRAVSSRPNIQVTPVQSQSSTQQLPQLQRMPSPQVNQAQSQQQQRTPQVIVIDGDPPPPPKMPTMSNTSRLSHYPSSSGANSGNSGGQSFHGSVTGIPTHTRISQIKEQSPQHPIVERRTSPSRPQIKEQPLPHPIVNRRASPSRPQIKEQPLPHPIIEHHAPPSRSQILAELANRHSLSITNIAVKQEKSTDQLPSCSVSQTPLKEYDSPIVDAASKSLNDFAKQAIGSFLDEPVRKTSQSGILQADSSGSPLQSIVIDESSNPSSAGDSSTISTKSVTIKPKSQELDKSSASPISIKLVSQGTEKDSTISVSSENKKNSESAEPKLGNTSESLSPLEELLKFSKKPGSFMKVSKKKPDGFKNGDNLSTIKSETLEQSKEIPIKIVETRSLTESDLDPAQSIPQEDPNEDWCAVCHDGGDLLCCGNCPRVYHLQCHVPALNTTPNEDWTCLMCKDVKNAQITEETSGLKRKLFGLSGRELLLCERILLEVFCNESSPPFHQPISKKVPNYHKVISKPMDLSTMRIKLSTSHFNHYASVEEFLGDMRLVFKNCYTYNPKDSELYEMAKTLEDFFDELLNKYLPEYAYDTTVGLSQESVDSPGSDGAQRIKRSRKTWSDDMLIQYW